MIRSFSDYSRADEDRANGASERLASMLRDTSIIKEYKEQLARLDEGMSDDLEPQDISKFADMSLCYSLCLSNNPVRDGPVFFGNGTGADAEETLFYDVLYVRSSLFLPLPHRKAKGAGSLYHSLSLVSPPGEARMSATTEALQNMYLRMSTASASRTFAEYSTRPWCAVEGEEQAHELFLTSRTLTHTEDIKSGRVRHKACAIPEDFDAHGGLQNLVSASRGSLCFTEENLVRICDLTVPNTAPKEVRFPGPDAIVSGQLVYVTFSIRGTVGKPVHPKMPMPHGGWKYSFKPTMRSIFILSKAGPMIMAQNSMGTRSKAPRVQADELGVIAEPDISGALKRLRLA